MIHDEEKRRLDDSNINLHMSTKVQQVEIPYPVHYFTNRSLNFKPISVSTLLSIRNNG